MIGCSSRFFGSMFFLLSLLLSVSKASYVKAEESVCAQVKIEIRQEMTFERQAFDAHMNINNGLTTLPLEDINVEVSFQDEEGTSVTVSSNPDDPDALFFIRLYSIEGISDVSGSGTIGPSNAADIHWLIIPSPAAVEGVSTYKLYFVGARLTYTLGGEEQETIVTPDSIRVKPLPLITLDYFLPDEVYGDDPFTSEVEASVPFSLGVRVSNNGLVAAGNFKIDSAQPKIIENELGLTVDFLIEGSEVNGEEGPDSLLINFGDIEAQSSKIGRWLMTSSLSGRFVEFRAEYSHADDLGGELTSLLENVDTHFLVQDVLVDLPGRDNIRDLLGKDNDVYRVFESDAGVSDVQNVSDDSSLAVEQNLGSTVTYELTTSPVSGFSYVQLDDPQNGSKELTEAIRSDGKILSLNNAWLSKKRVGSDWFYYVNLFDINPTSSYRLTFTGGASAAATTPAVTTPDTDEITAEKEGNAFSLLVTAESVNGSLKTSVTRTSSDGENLTGSGESSVEISSGSLPVGATFTDLGNGQGLFSWNPESGQAGEYLLTFTSTDGDQQDTVIYTLLVTNQDNVPTAHFSGSVQVGASPLEVLFVDQSSSEDGLKYWNWDFGDGETSTDENPYHVYQSEGSYTVSLEVTEIDGDNHLVSYPDYITVGLEEVTPTIEFDTLSVDQNWHEVTFNELFVDPVIVASVVETTENCETVSVRVGDISSTGFFIKLEGECSDEAILPVQEASFIAVERGVYGLANGEQIIADYFDSSPDNVADSITFSTPCSQIPVVVAAVGSDLDTTPVNVVVDNVSLSGFTAKLQPEEIPAVIHGTERIDYIAWEPSVGIIGSVLFESAHFSGVETEWKTFSYNYLFNIPPVVTALPQSYYEDNPTTILIDNSTISGVDIELVEYLTDPENTGENQLSESVGYISVAPITADMDTDNDGISDLAEIKIYGTSATDADTDGDGLNDYVELIYWGERWKNDTDNDGLINLLDSDSDNDGSDDGQELEFDHDPADPTSFPGNPVIETGTISVDHNWQTISFSKTFIDPVVVATVSGVAGSDDPAVVRTRNISSSACEFKLEESSTADGTHLLEEVSYIVVERGSYTLENGARVIADKAEMYADNTLVSNTFRNAMPTTPVMMATIGSTNNDTAIDLALDSVDQNGFSARLQPNGNSVSGAYTEQVNYIAWEISEGLIDALGFSVGVLEEIGSDWVPMSFSQSFTQPPTVTACRQTDNIENSETVQVQGRLRTPSGIDLRIAEQSESSATEVVGFIIIGN